MKKSLLCPAVREFHISRKSRDLYRFEQGLFSSLGNVIFADFHASRVFAQKMNARRDAVRFPERAVRAGEINALGLIDEILHFVIRHYRKTKALTALEDAYSWLCEELGETPLTETLLRFTEAFPPIAVYNHRSLPADFLAAFSEDDLYARPIANRILCLEEMLLLWLANENPAFQPYRELFDDALLKEGSAYPTVIARMKEFFESQPKFGPRNLDLIDFLRSPAIAVPDSIQGQLEYIRTNWGWLLGDFMDRLLSSLDLIREEEISRTGGPGPNHIFDLDALSLDGDSEGFSPDKDWMPSLVLIAKNIYVWLDQLSKKYRRPIRHLDHIPDEELARLHGWGFTGLWLIGIWERSPASQKIKHLCGNPDAVASAYSLYDYQIAHDLGGDAAFENLKERAWRTGIRLAADMVPNHSGIYSKWVVEHPEWFISLDYSPFPAYTFNGPDLSPDNRLGIYLEDHYYQQSDAAVVFKRVDRQNGREKFIYHGNDGTSMPWNDTAQLDFLNPEVREAVIQTILHVARKFSVIRFDAAMTLAKKHIQRLWYPEPGTGGAIPSRSDFGLSQAQFDERMPVEFWREVVDRVAQEVPDTLLLAEAFWLMEGYFVRTLGMHRVYNSAFMNMLRDEKNAEFRQVIKNTLEFDPEILKRFVNFMNNPDEDTALSQFGKEDKYFGICTMLATLPGLPMFGHGQIEGFTEKYGMEYRRAYLDEQPDKALVARHEREIFPLLRKRSLFAGVENFSLYDAFSRDGRVNEGVFAYSNRLRNEKALVVYHNKWAEARGWVKTSAAFSAPTGEAGKRTLIQRSLAEGLGIEGTPRKNEGRFLIFKDQISGLEFIRNIREIQEEGLYFELGAYKTLVFMDFREITDDDQHHYSRLAATLNGRGVPDIQAALQEIFLQPILNAYGALINPETIRGLIPASDPEKRETIDFAHPLRNRLVHLLREISQYTGGSGDVEQITDEILTCLRTAQRLPALTETLPEGRHGILDATPGDDPVAWGTLFSWVFSYPLGRVVAPEEFAIRSHHWIDEWSLGQVISDALRGLGAESEVATGYVELMKTLVLQHSRLDVGEPDEGRAYRTFVSFLDQEPTREFLQANRYAGKIWVNREAFIKLTRWSVLMAVIERVARSPLEEGEFSELVEAFSTVARRLVETIEATHYEVESALDLLKPASPSKGTLTPP